MACDRPFRGLRALVARKISFQFPPGWTRARGWTPSENIARSPATEARRPRYATPRFIRFCGPCDKGFEYRLIEHIRISGTGLTKAIYGLHLRPS